MCGQPTTFNFNPNPYKSHFSGPEVYTSSMIYPWDEEKACTGPGSRLGPPWQGITESQVLKWPRAGACALKGHTPWAPGTLCLVRRIQLKGPSVKAKVRASLAKSGDSARDKSALCPNVCFSNHPTPPNWSRVDISPTLYSLQSTFTYNALEQSSQSCKITT